MRRVMHLNIVARADGDALGNSDTEGAGTHASGDACKNNKKAD